MAKTVSDTQAIPVTTDRGWAPAVMRRCKESERFSLQSLLQCIPLISFRSPLDAVHTITLVSMLPEAIYSELGDQAMAMTLAVWKRRSLNCCREKRELELGPGLVYIPDKKLCRRGKQNDHC